MTVVITYITCNFDALCVGC